MTRLFLWALSEEKPEQECSGTVSARSFYLNLVWIKKKRFIQTVMLRSAFSIVLKQGLNLVSKGEKVELWTV